jgi:hypothetical protein
MRRRPLLWKKTLAMCPCGGNERRDTGSRNARAQESVVRVDLDGVTQCPTAPPPENEVLGRHSTPSVCLCSELVRVERGAKEYERFILSDGRIGRTRMLCYLPDLPVLGCRACASSASTPLGSACSFMPTALRATCACAVHAPSRLRMARNNAPFVANSGRQ